MSLVRLLLLRGATVLLPLPTDVALSARRHVRRGQWAGWPNGGCRWRQLLTGVGQGQGQGHEMWRILLTHLLHNQVSAIDKEEGGEGGGWGWDWLCGIAWSMDGLIDRSID